MPFMFGRGRRAKSSAKGYLGMPYVGSRMPGEGVDAAFNTNMTMPASGNRVMSTLGPGPSSGSGRVIASRADYGPVMAARRARGMNLGGSLDPGLSTRGNVAGSRVRPMPGPRGGTGRGLETRGVRPVAGSRVRPVKPVNVGMPKIKVGSNLADRSPVLAELGTRGSMPAMRAVSGEAVNVGMPRIKVGSNLADRSPVLAELGTRGSMPARRAVSGEVQSAVEAAARATRNRAGDVATTGSSRVTK